MHPLVPITLLAAAAPALAAIGGKCTHLVGTELDISTGICLTISECNQYGGDSSWKGYCPYDGNSVRCCFIDNCNKEYSACTWTDGPKGYCSPEDGDKWIKDKCPGPSTYKCCQH